MFDRLAQICSRAARRPWAMIQAPRIFPANDGRPTLHVRRQNLDGRGRYASLTSLQGWPGHVLFDPDLGDVTIGGHLQIEGAVISAGGTSLTILGRCSAERIILKGGLTVRDEASIRNDLAVEGAARFGAIEAGSVSAYGDLTIEGAGSVRGELHTKGHLCVAGGLNVEGDLIAERSLSAFSTKAPACVVGRSLRAGENILLGSLDVQESIHSGGAILLKSALRAGERICAGLAVHAARIDCGEISAGLGEKASGGEREIHVSSGGFKGAIRYGVLVEAKEGA